MNYTIYGGKADENITQALARHIVFMQALELEDLGYRVVLRVHDEIVLVVPDEQVSQALVDMERVMSQPVSWLPNCPIGCEVGAAVSYVEAK